MQVHERRGTGGPRTLPLLPLRDLVVLPHGAASFVVGRPRSVAALEAALQSDDRAIFLAGQKDPMVADPEAADLHLVGTIGSVVRVLRLPDGKLKALVDGRLRARALHLHRGESTWNADLEELTEVVRTGPTAEALMRAVKGAFDELARQGRNLPPDTVASALAIEEPGRLADVIARQALLKPEICQQILELLDTSERLERVHLALHEELEFVGIERKMRSRIQRQTGRASKDMGPDNGLGFQRDLGEKDENRAELDELEERLAARGLPSEARDRVQRELRKLRGMNPMSAEATVLRSWFDHVVALPWNDLAPDRLDLAEAERVLAEDHHGLKRVKSRVLEHLAVMKLRGGAHGSVLCLVGPPGVGKTSLARSIARATGRPFVRVALGGVRDEAEIRGHRRTYIGAFPGRILTGLKRAGKANPVFLLDEIDKLTSDLRGDPGSALLEVLDPEQNTVFSDHYLDMDTDLSRVLFICTANSTSGIPGPLLDRLEIVRIGGYTEAEKRAIATRYLLPRQREACGLVEGQVEITGDALDCLVHEYTREAGVRNLEREIGAVCRKVARRVVQKGPETRIRIDRKRLEKLLGPPRHRAARLGQCDESGFVNGLAWTSAGGVMVPIEAAVVRGNGKTTMTGQLGTVFRESCEAALTYIRSRAAQLGLEPDFWQNLDVHVHVPELWGVDGPSAGITLTTAVVSAVCRHPVRRDVAMTGEITLRGHVRPIGGVKEKLLAASQAGVKRVLLPRDNARDLHDVPRSVRESLDIRFVDHMDEVLVLALAVESPSDIFPGLALEPTEESSGEARLPS